MVSSVNSLRVFKEKSREKLREIAGAIEPIVGDSTSLVVTGSYGRLEATSGSDFDYFLLSRNDESPETAQALVTAVADRLRDLRVKSPSAEGVFGKEIVKRSALATDIGGKKDTNDTITRRVLFLTEARPVVGESCFNECLKNLISRYVGE